MYTPEDRQKHVGRARATLYPRQIRLLCITWLPVEGIEGTGQSRATCPPCAAWALGANAGYTPEVRPALEQQAVTMLFLQLNHWSSEERHFIFNHLRWCFTRYTVLSTEFVFNLSKLLPKTYCYHKFRTHFFLLKIVRPLYVQNKLIKCTIIVDIGILEFNAHCMGQKITQKCRHWTRIWRPSNVFLTHVQRT